jgi:hypothetical protein
VLGRAPGSSRSRDGDGGGLQYVSGKAIRPLGFFHRGDFIITSQDFIKFWSEIFVLVLLVLIESSQGFQTF